MEQYYKIKDVAKMLSVTIRTVYRWIDDGKITATRINENPRISESEITRITKGE